ncbi:MAG: DUF456 domain-containing protein [Spirochaetales bacterium]|nr:DUF456 domain-containing protein [Spirochaetales bacterium]
MESLVLEIILFSVSLFGVLLSLIGLPGGFLPPVAALVSFLWGGSDKVSLAVFLIILFLFISGEVMDQIAGIFGAKKGGASRPGMVGAGIGGLLGAIIGTSLLPVIGSLIGVFAGAFAGTFLFEKFFSRKTHQESYEASKGALMGKVLASALKLAVGAAMLVLLGMSFWSSNG